MFDLQQILNDIQAVTNIKPTAFKTEYRKETGTVKGINYDIYPMSNDGAVAVYRLQIRIIEQSLERAMKAADKITDLLVTLGDEYKYNSAISVEGGGMLEDEVTGLPIQILYFTITTGTRRA